MLKAQNISCGYEDDFILENISFSIKPKQITGIIGPNGSGKTTLLRALTKVVQLRAGRIYLDGKNISLMNFRQLAQRVAMVAQDFQLQFDSRVEEFISLGRIPHQARFQFFESKKDQAIVDRAMELTQTIQFKDRFLKTLSGGERQLVIIAKALAQEPKILLLDEPTVFLDITHQIQILDLITKLHKQEKFSVIVVLHELNLASEYCDNLILLSGGKIKKSGTPREVLTKEIIEQVYCTPVILQKHPLSKRPNIIALSQVEK